MFTYTNIMLEGQLGRSMYALCFWSPLWSSFGTSRRETAVRAETVRRADRRTDSRTDR